MTRVHGLGFRACGSGLWGPVRLGFFGREGDSVFFVLGFLRLGVSGLVM